jgi:cytochrome P450
VPDTWPIPGNLSFLRAARRLDAVIYAIVERRRAELRRGQGPDDLLSVLLRAQDADGSGMTDQQLRDEVMTLLLAGHETTAVALTWTWYLLARHPAVEAALLSELRSVLGDRAPHPDDLAALPYTNQVVAEAMRLFPPAWAVAREAVEPVRIGDTNVPPGTICIMSQWIIQRDGRFFDRAELFAPERWSGDLARRLPRFAYFPFGGGPRVCLGSSFALTEAMLVLATVAPRFHLELAPGQRVVPWPSITLRPRGGLRVVVRERG